MMPRSADEPRPLTRQQISQVLRGIASPPDSISPQIALEAMTVTAHELMAWCRPAEVVSCVESTLTAGRAGRAVLAIAAGV